MPTAGADTDHLSWSAEGYPHVVEYAPRVIAEICADAVEGLYRLRRTGIEIGGVLFGTREGFRLRITAWRTVACEHALGPAFSLSEKDRAGLEQLLAAAKSDPELAGLVPVGWYHSHTRAEISLSPSDVELHEKYFPEPWQIAVVIKPAHFGPSQVGIFVRDASGALKTDASPKEFLAAPAKRIANPLQRMSAKEPAVTGASGSEKNAEAELPQADTAVEDVSGSDIQIEPPAFAQMPGRFRWKYVLIPLCCALASGGVWAGRQYVFPPESRPLSVRAIDAEGQVFLEWDRTATAVRNASGATLLIQDGADSSTISLDRDRVRLGSVTYKRRSEQVEFRLKVQGGEPAEAVVRLVGQPVPYRPSQQELDAVRERDELRQQVEALRSEIQKRDAYIRRMGHPPAPARPITQPARPPAAQD